MIHNVFNKDLLTKYRKLQFSEQCIEPVLPLDIINEEEEYKVKKIRKHGKQEWKTQFLVYWKGYGDENDQWIAEMGLSYAKEMIEDYWTRVSS